MNDLTIPITIDDATPIPPISVALTATTIGGLKLITKAMQDMATLGGEALLSAQMVQGPTQEQVGLALKRVIEQSQRSRGHIV